MLYTLSQLLMENMLGKKVTKIGRIAGQYAKPRSNPTEIVDGETMNSFFGDNVNKFDPTKEGRIPDIKRLLQGYHWSVTTYHSLKQIEEDIDMYETLKHVLNQRLRESEKIDRDSDDYVNFANSLKDSLESESEIGDTFISHEGLLLNYESRLTRLLEPSESHKKVSIYVSLG